MQIAVHAIGDGAMEMGSEGRMNGLWKPIRTARTGGTELYTARLRRAGFWRHFFRGVTGCTPTFSPFFLDYDNHIVEARIGAERAGETYQFKTLLSIGVSVSNGSDCPVESAPDVVTGIQ